MTVPATGYAAIKTSDFASLSKEIDFSFIKKASDLISRLINYDKIQSSAADRFSGSYSKDYQQLPIAHFFKEKNIPFPSVLTEQFDKMVTKCLMGLFPEIGHVWMTVDNRLFLWNYEDQESFASYDFEDENELILTVVLVTPRPGVFIAEIEYLIALATTSKIILLGLRKLSKTADSYEICSTPLAVSSDDIAILSMKGSDDGRLFMCGSDGNLYELEYENQDSWFSSQCRKKNRSSSLLSSLLPSFFKFTQNEAIVSMSLDKSRNILYALSLANSLFVYDVSPGKCTRLAVCDDPYSAFISLYPQSLLFKRENFKIMSIHHLTESESSHYTLLALTSSGVRLYFQLTTLSRPYFELRHVRLPYQSTHVNGSTGIRPFGHSFLDLHSAFYNRGVLMAANAFNDDEDVIWQVDACVCPKLNPGSPVETHSVFSLRGKTWEISECPSAYTCDKLVKRSPCDAGESKSDGEFFNSFSRLNEYLDQGMFGDRSFLVLSNSGIQVLRKHNSVHVLVSLLKNVQSLESEVLKTFMASFSPVELAFLAFTACVQVTTLSGKHVPTKSGISLTDMLFAIMGQNVPHEHNIDAKVLPSHSADIMALSSRSNDSASEDLSPKVLGVYLFLARSIRRLLRLSSPILFQTPAAPSTLIVLMQTTLELLEGTAMLLKNNYGSFFSTPSSAKWTLTSSELAQKDPEADQSAYFRLLYFCQYFSQGLKLILLVMDHPVLTLVNSLSSTSSSSFSSLTIEDLLLTKTGRDILVELVSLIIQKQISNNYSADTVVELFSEKCPFFFRESDFSYFKAFEVIHLANAASIQKERLNRIQESIEILRKSKGLSIDRLSLVAEEYRKLYQHPMCIKFLLECMDFQLSSFASIDHEKLVRPFVEIVTTLLDDAAYLYKNPPDELSNPKEFFVSCTESAVLSSLLSYHNQLYRWMIQKSWADVLISLPPSRYLETFLIDLVEESDLGGNLQDLLWKYYVQKFMYDEASDVLLKLGTSTKKLSLKSRLEYLRLSLTYIINSKSARKEDTLQEIKDLIEIAELQLEIFNVFKESSIRAHEYETLNDTLYSLSDLYNLFTSPFHAYEQSLKVIHLSQYSDVTLLTNIWMKLFDQLLDSSRGTFLTEALSKICSFGKKFLPSEIAFPTRFLFGHMLKLAFNHLQNVDVSMIARSFIEAGVPSKTLVEICEDLLEAKTSPWMQPVGQMFLLETLVSIFALQGAVGPEKMKKIASMISKLDPSSPLLSALISLVQK